MTLTAEFAFVSDKKFVSDKALAVGVRALKPAASALPLTRVTDRIVAMIGELSQ